MRKIPSEFENPIDNYIINFCDSSQKYFYDIGFTPNNITTLSNISCILVVILLLQAKYYWAAFFLIVSYYFDCLDGYTARTYKMTTVFGDYYDHISDLTKTVLVLLTLYYINPDKFFNVLPIIICFFILTLPHLGCQELYYNSSESNSLNFTKILCPVPNNYSESDIKSILKYTKYFGCGTFYIIFALIIIYYDF
jgi:hypothetical protein